MKIKEIEKLYELLMHYLHLSKVLLIFLVDFLLSIHIAEKKKKLKFLRKILTKLNDLKDLYFNFLYKTIYFLVLKTL